MLGADVVGADVVGADVVGADVVGPDVVGTSVGMLGGSVVDLPVRDSTEHTFVIRINISKVLILRVTSGLY